MEQAPRATEDQKELLQEHLADRTALQQEAARNPENERIKAYLTDVQNYISKVLAEIDRGEEVTSPETARNIGEAATQNMFGADITSPESEKAAEPAPQYMDSQGFVHSSRAEAINGDVARENYSSAPSGVDDDSDNKE